MRQSCTSIAAMATLAIACGGTLTTPGDFGALTVNDGSAPNPMTPPPPIEASARLDSQTSGGGGFAQEAAVESRSPLESGVADSATADASESGADDGSSIKCLGPTGAGLTCGDLCTAFFKVCKYNPGTANAYPDKAACLNVCKTLTQPQLCCRVQHAMTLANIPDPGVNDILTHCPHTIGVSPCT